MPGDVYEVRWHGRGGQGAKTGALLLAEALMEGGKFIQAFPEYGAERSGAPMRAYDRISDKPIIIHSPIETPDAVLVIDSTLIEVENVAEGVPDGGIILVNTEKSPDEIAKEINTDGRNIKIYTVDATGISMEVFGKNFPNVPMLGAFVRVTGIGDIETLKQKIEHKFARKGKSIVEKNMQAIERGYKEVKGL